ncbi:hypothetical protein [Carboxydothermus hydrogenoformans]|uniref:NurA domain-containing protein n=1 Tax=Carboxydothermus hydrogenoformans (strain ATCC BAA-161 / DSM 6008 / Z-2901) TaxID=246194 RepID=Q3AAA0_CARHZ|nr:hypothetical protein [Carboxydothermus hydrogenoformans]ABB14117.1 hypothetical protein CHY_2120 [Carboxydothermus hydrogenoformans Z-2901]
MLYDLDITDFLKKLSYLQSYEKQLLERFCSYARQLKQNLKPIRPYTTSAISIVASDGGDNRIYFNPAVYEFVRVACSIWDKPYFDVFSSSAGVEQFIARTKPGEYEFGPLRRLCQDLGLEVTELSHLFTKFNNPRQFTLLMRAYREIIEWAVLYDLLNIEKPFPLKQVIFIRDGLLRSFVFKWEVFAKLDDLFRKKISKLKNLGIEASIVGIAKRSAVLSRLAVALALEETFFREGSWYVEVPREIEKACYEGIESYITTREDLIAISNTTAYQAMGKLFLVKFGPEKYSPVWPVDIAVWQKDAADKILGKLIYDARQGFPIPDYPRSVQEAHEKAKISKIEMIVLQDEITRHYASAFNKGNGEKLERFKYLGEKLNTFFKGE